MDNVWIRIFPFIENDSDHADGRKLSCHARLDIYIYRTEVDARAVQAKKGGVVIEVSPSSLRGLNEFDDEVLLAEDNYRGKSPIDAWVAVDISKVEHSSRQTEQGLLVKFPPASEAWLDQLAKETGFEIHQ